MAKSDIKDGENLHCLITRVLIERLSNDEIQRGDIDSAIKWLQANGITSFANDTPTAEIASNLRKLPDLPDEDIWADEAVG